MRKITLMIMALFGTVIGLNAQTYSTGMVTFFSGAPSLAYSGQVDVTNTTVTVTLVGPSDKWLGIGFDASSLMNDTGKDVLIFNGTTMSDRSFDGVGVTPPTDTQNWTVQSNNIVSGVRTVVATRARVASEGTDYTFPLAAQPLHLTFARGTSLTVTYHGSGNCGSTMSNLTLGSDSFEMASLKMYPNPSKGYINIELPQMVTEADVIFYDLLGKQVKTISVSSDSPRIETSDLPSGSYVVKIKSSAGEGTRTLVVN
ncbi:T9SS type A sorting domain-containing protein [Flavobacterium sp.]|uniref:T9SS type A sorting domain-containing protein n=1 Tax=Flavobacterium sp. TaxID=239 RepID=UPI0028BD3483|nr:T9SS type A sorting domain-containing protein [Flavobacterium sp.]